MSKAPSMPLFCGDYLADTKHLTLEQHGAYMLLLMITWRNNGQPVADDDALLARYLSTTKDRWSKKIRPALEPLFDLSAGTWKSARLEKEWQFVQKRCEVKRENGKQGGRPKSLKTKDPAKPVGSVSDKLNESTHTYTHTQDEESREGKPSLADEPASTVTRLPRPPDDAGFREFYAAYPLKKDPGRAEKAYRAACKLATHAEIMVGVARYAAEREGQDPHYTKHPTTWLNAKAWLNEPAAVQSLFTGDMNVRNRQPSPEEKRDSLRSGLARGYQQRMDARSTGYGGAG